MRLVLVVVASLAVCGCDDGRKVLDVLFGVTEAEEEERSGYGPEPAYDEEGDPSGGGEAADLDDAPEGAEAGSASCDGITDAEAFVRCLYEGMAAGSVRTGQEPDGPAYLSERYWRTVQQMRAAGPGWADMDALCLCNAPGATRLFRARIGAPIDDGAAVEIVLEQNGQMGNLRVELLRTDEGWRVNDVVAHSG